MSENQPKISVIVPVYKAEAYLHRCVDSLLAQTFQDFEILLIDDGSPDRSGEICDEYARKDKRVRVFHKENGGVSSARNFGIDNAGGEWITFVDSDDYVAETYLHDFGLETIDADFYLQGYKVKCNEFVIKEHYFSICETCGLSFSKCFIEGERSNILNSPVCKLFKTNIVKKNNVNFDVIVSYGEDHLFVLWYLMYAQNIVASPDMSYYYMHSNNTSLTNRLVPIQEMLYYTIKSNRYQLCFLRYKGEYDNEMIGIINWRTYSNLMLNVQNALKYKIGRMKKLRMIKMACKELSYSYIGLLSYQKCSLLILRYFPVFLSYIFFYVAIHIYYKYSSKSK